MTPSIENRTGVLCYQDSLAPLHETQGELSVIKKVAHELACKTQGLIHSLREKLPLHSLSVKDNLPLNQTTQRVVAGLERIKTILNSFEFDANELHGQVEKLVIASEKINSERESKLFFESIANPLVLQSGWGSHAISDMSQKASNFRERFVNAHNSISPTLEIAQKVVNQLPVNNSAKQAITSKTSSSNS